MHIAGIPASMAARFAGLWSIPVDVSRMLKSECFIASQMSGGGS